MNRHGITALNDIAVNEFQGNLRRYLENCDVSQSELARKLGISSACVSQYVRGVIPISKTVMLAIKYVLGTEE